MAQDKCGARSAECGVVASSLRTPHSAFRNCTYSASPCALSPIVRSLIALQPIGYIRPRRPPVPNGITVQKTSSNSFHWPAAMCSATCEAYCAYRGCVSHWRMFSLADLLSEPRAIPFSSCARLCWTSIFTSLTTAGLAHEPLPRVQLHSQPEFAERHRDQD